MKTLNEAANQWASRPADERYWTLTDCYEAARVTQDACMVGKIDARDLSVKHIDGDLYVNGKTRQAKLNNWSFSQLCGRAHAPAGYLTGLSDETASKALQEGLARSESENCSLLVQETRSNDSALVCRAITSDKYTRIWNGDVLNRLIALEQSGWKVPPARPSRGNSETRIATENDVLRNAAHPTLGIKVGDEISPAGIYLSDRDFFAFMVEEDHPITDNGNVLYRGFFTTNSEVGATALTVTQFLLNSVCGNHIVWDVSEVKKLRIVHRGHADLRFDREFHAQLTEYANESAGTVESKIRQARSFSLGDNKEQVLDFVFGKKFLTKSESESCYQAAIDCADLHSVDPNSAWGYAQGITSYSQRLSNTDDRTRLDTIAGKIIEVAF